MQLRRTLFIVSALAALSGLGLTIALKRSDPTAMIERALKGIAHQLPFEIESVEVRKSWRELLRGRLSSLAIRLKWGEFRLRLAGPVEVKKDARDTDLIVTYDPEITIEPVGHPERASSPLDLHLWVEATRTFSEVHAFGMNTRSAKWSWDFYGIGLSQLTAISGWRENRWESRVVIEALSFENPAGGNPSMELKGLRFSQGMQMTLVPFEAGKDTGLRLEGKTADVLWNGILISVPLEKFPLQVNAQIDPKTPSLSAKLSLGALQLDGAVTGSGGVPNSAKLRWNLPELDLRVMAEGLTQIVPQWTPALQSLGLRAGKLKTSGRAQFRLPAAAGTYPEVEGHVRLSDVSIKPESQPLLVQGAVFDLPFSTSKGIHGTLALERAAYKHLEVSLAPVPLAIVPEKSASGAPRAWSVRVGDGSRLPLKVGDIPFQVGTISGSLITGIPGIAGIPGGAPGEKADFTLETSLELAPTPTEKLTRPFCLTGTRVPPAQVELQFPRVEISRDSIDPTGQVRAELFGGVIEADEIGIFDLGSPVPELDFTAEMRNIRLEKIGQWLNFGEMKGSLEGYARDVTFQSWLPTRFDARIEVKPPADRSRVVFSPAAVQNFVEVVAGSRLENIPGLVKWYAFGTPRYIFGGYDIDYAGVKLRSEDGVVELETLDPPEIYKKEKKRFILYGASIMDRVPVIGAVAWGGFRVPIQSPRYPVLMDAPAIANYIRQLTERLKALSERTSQPQEKTDAELDLECEPTENPKS